MSRLRIPLAIISVLCCTAFTCAALLCVPRAAYAQDKSDVEGRTAAVADYVKAHVPDWADADGISKALVDAGENWPELAAALTHYAVPTEAADADQNHAYACMVWLLENAPHLDRLELTTDILVGNMDLALGDAGDFGYDTTGDFFRRNVLNYRLDDEPVTAWRPELAFRYTPPMSAGYGPGDLGRAQKIIDYATRDFTVLKRGYFGNLADPVSIDNARAGSERELSMLIAAILRSQGFATRYVRENRTGKSWVEVYIGDASNYDAANWVPVYPTAPDKTGSASYARELCDGNIAVVTAGDAFGMEQVTARYTDVCAVHPVFTQDDAGGEPQEMQDFEHWAITAWNGSTYEPLDDLGYPVSAEDYPLTYGEGVEAAQQGVYYVGAPADYQLQAGVRYPGGIVHVVTKDFSAEPGGNVDLTIDLTAPADLPQEALVDRKVATELPDGLEDVRLGKRVYVVYDDGEPSVRARSALHNVAWDNMDTTYTEIDYATTDEQYRQLIDTVLNVKDKDMLPVVIALKDGETLLYQRGYNINIRDWVLRVLE